MKIRMSFCSFGLSTLENPVCFPVPRFVVVLPSVKLWTLVPELRMRKRTSSPRVALRRSRLIRESVMVTWTVRNTSGTVDEVRAKLDTLDEHCAAVGRDRSTLELTISFPITIRDEVAAAVSAARERFRANGVENAGAGPHLYGPPAAIAEAIAPYRDLGFATVIVRMPAPYDRETIDRMADVQALLAPGG